MQIYYLTLTPHMGVFFDPTNIFNAMHFEHFVSYICNTNILK